MVCRYAHLRKARPLKKRKMYSKLKRHASFDDDWIKGLVKLFKIRG